MIDDLDVGFCRDPRKTLAYLARAWPRVTFHWLAWFEDSKANATHFVSEVVERHRVLVLESRNADVWVARPLPFVISHVETIALRCGVTLTPHAVAVQRARTYAQRLGVVLDGLQRAGHFTAFNRSYRMYREARRLGGESAAPFWAVKEQLRQMIIRHLVAQKSFDQNALLEEIRKRFPWFKLNGGLHLASGKHKRN
jgi:hypothetical protein